MSASGRLTRVDLTPDDVREAGHERIVKMRRDSVSSERLRRVVEASRAIKSEEDETLA